jgi:hypothetical protein
VSCFKTYETGVAAQLVQFDGARRDLLAGALGDWDALGATHIRSIPFVAAGVPAI